MAGGIDYKSILKLSAAEREAENRARLRYLNEKVVAEAESDVMTAELKGKDGLAFTVTFKQGLLIKNDVGSFWMRLDEAIAEKTMRAFAMNLSRAAFGNAARRGSARIGISWQLEVSLAGRLHAHGWVVRPESMLSERLDFFFRRELLALDWVHREMCLRPIDDADGWVKYILKDASKSRSA